MAYIFFDTSALVKRYYREQGTDTVDDIIEDEKTDIVITTLSVVEIASAFRRKHNRNEISRDAVDALLRGSSRKRLRTFCWCQSKTFRWKRPSTWF